MGYAPLALRNFNTTTRGILLQQVPPVLSIISFVSLLPTSSKNLSCRGQASRKGSEICRSQISLTVAPTIEIKRLRVSDYSKFEAPRKDYSYSDS